MTALTLCHGTERTSNSNLPSPPAAEQSAFHIEQKMQLHRGRHSVVWSGWCPTTHQPLVLKTYEKDKMKGRHVLNARREIDILQQYTVMRHPGVVSLLHHWEDEHEINLVFEQCSGGDLFQNLIKQGGKLHEAYVCCQVVVPLLSTLHHLHSNRIVHRDIKPENLFLTTSGQLKLGDFGLAVSLNVDRALARVGTLDYMAPEVLNMPPPEELSPDGNDDPPPSEAPGYTEKVDIWALGVLVYELLSGKPPFEVEDTDATTQLIQTALLQSFPDHISPSCQEFIRHSLRRNPQERPSATELLKHPWIMAHQDTLDRMSSLDSTSSGDWSLKVVYLSGLSLNTKSSCSAANDASPVSSPRQSTGTHSSPLPPARPASPPAWKKPCDSPLKRPGSGMKSRFARPSGISPLAMASVEQAYTPSSSCPN